MGSTRRQQIVETLQNGPLTVLEIAARFQAPVKTVLVDLEHIRKSCEKDRRFIVEPAECLSCSFVFRERARLGTPSRCPRCRSEQIQDPRFSIGV
jgi:hypothetical protein